MHFMEAEFDFADKEKNGELDPKELRQSRARTLASQQGAGTLEDSPSGAESFGNLRTVHVGGLLNREWPTTLLPR